MFASESLQALMYEYKKFEKNICKSVLQQFRVMRDHPSLNSTEQYLFLTFERRR